MSNNKEKLGSVYFNNNDTELSELADDLNSMKIELQKEAMKQIIASMTIGKDVSQLFPQVVICMRTQNIELKKLIYLYIINYARAKPDLTILAVNAFHQDATDKNSPLIRALAVRTMGCIRVNTIVSYLSETLKLSLKDEDAYVRKTACFCVAKLFSTCPSLVRENGFIESLEELLSDGNAVVVSSALISLMEISILSGKGPFKIRSKILKRILLALNETNEWGVVYILDSLTFYKPKKIDVAEKCIEAIIPKLTHSNPAVIISAVKVILNLMDFYEENSKNTELIKGYYKKLSNSLITIVKSIPEIQYSLLRSIHIIIQKRPTLLEKDFRYFFIEYNDPIYVKLEKLDILYKLADEKNFEYIITELRSYAITEFDQEIITKAFKYMGAIIFKNSKAYELGVKCLFDIFNHGESFIVNQAVITMRDLLRKYQNPKTLELLNIINIDFVKKINLPESKSAILYILGEFADKINSSVDIINWFSGNFQNENEKVKAQILNAAIKNFVIKPNVSEELTKYILEKAGEECENPDIRDRAYIYWRLLENDPDAAKEMLLGEKPNFIYKEEEMFEKTLLEDLVENLTNISCLYQKKSNEIIRFEDLILENQTSDEKEDEVDNKDDKNMMDTKNNDLEKLEKNKKKTKTNKIIESKINTNDYDLLGLGDSGNNSVTLPSNTNIYNLDIMDLFGGTKNDFNTNLTLSNINNNLLNNDFNHQNNNKVKDYEDPTSKFNNIHDKNNFPNYNNDLLTDIQFLDDEGNSEYFIFSKVTGVSQPKPYKALEKDHRGKNGIYGLYASGLFHRENTNIYLGLHLENHFHLGMNSFAILIPKNFFGIIISPEKNKHLDDFFLNSENKKNLILNLNIDNNNRSDFNIEINNIIMIDVVIKNNLDDFSIKIPLYLNVLNQENGKMNNQNFMEFFKKFSQNRTLVNYTNELKKEILNEDSLNKILERNNIFLVAKNTKLDPPVFFYSGLIQKNLQYILEISFLKGVSKGISIKIISEQVWFNLILKETLDTIFKD